MNVARSKQPGDHRRKQAALRQTAELAIERIKDKIRQDRGPAAAWLYCRYLAAVREYLPLREHPKHYIMYNFWLAKQAVLEIAADLVRQNIIGSSDDIFYLSFSEIKELVTGGGEAKRLITERKKNYAVFRGLALPRLITSEGEIIRALRDSSHIPAGAIQGVSVSAGIVEGRAKVVLDPHAETLDKGEILVARFTDPGWTPLFINAAGLVMEVGGIMTHGSIVAREYGIPAVVGVEDATKLIKTGQLLRVNGDAGYIEILRN